jgi:hypothetical protein
VGSERATRNQVLWASQQPGARSNGRPTAHHGGAVPRDVVSESLVLLATMTTKANIALAEPAEKGANTGTTRRRNYCTMSTFGCLTGERGSTLPM